MPNKSLKAGALVFVDDLPSGDGVNVKNVLTLTAKQLDNLAGIHQITTLGRVGWLRLANLVGVGTAGAYVSSEGHNKGDKYVDQNGEEKTYATTGFRNNVDSIVLDKDTTKALKQANINDIIEAWGMSDLLPTATPEPVVETDK